ncbi:type IV fimbrial biogenesis protein FimT [Oxalobacteraceae bacterium GrIS 1.18]
MQMTISHHRLRCNGFSLVELMVTLIIIAIFLGLAIPSFASFIQQIRLSTVTNELHAAIKFTRTEAIKRNGKVDLIALNEDWKNGWVVTSAENEQIMTHEALHTDFEVNGRFSDGKQHIAYNGTGHSRRNNSSYAAQSGHIHISLGDHSRLVVINFLGRARVCNPATDRSCNVNSDE